MPRVAKELSAIEISRLKEPGYHFVGGVAGLILQVTDNGARSWILRTTVGGRRRDIGLGGYPTQTLAGAREKARETVAQIRQGADPLEQRKAAKSALAAARAAAITFEEAAKKYIADNEAGWTNAKHAAQWPATLKKYVYPTIGKIHVASIETQHVISVLQPIWTIRTETAGRVRARIEVILDWARARGYRTGENPARWKGHLSAILPASSKVKQVKHHAALDFRQIGSFIEALRRVHSTGARALEFAILTAARSGEVRGAQWSEIDWQARVWAIPAARMKAAKEHRVPLTDAALAILNAMPRLAGSDFIFPSSVGKAQSDMTLTATIRRMHQAELDAGRSGWTDNAGAIITVHGFRSTFRDWAGETTNYPREVSEHALAHQLPDKAEASYARGTLFDKRKSLMRDWANFCEIVDIRPAAVVPIRRA